MTLSELVNRAFKNSVDHGFWDTDKRNNIPYEYTVSMRLALIHSEVSEALEEVRSPSRVPYSHPRNNDSDGKPCGLDSELADIVIRVADLCGWLGIDLDDIILRKMKYNESRPYKHGKGF